MTIVVVMQGRLNTSTSSHPKGYVVADVENPRDVDFNQLSASHL
jgi:hypothetical protein